MKIGIFDSGIGGLSVLYEAMNNLYIMLMKNMFLMGKKQEKRSLAM